MISKSSQQTCGLKAPLFHDPALPISHNHFSYRACKNMELTSWYLKLFSPILKCLKIPKNKRVSYFWTLFTKKSPVVEKIA